eukprot:2280285-Pleurochrysis_carterae.AAC.1
MHLFWWSSQIITWRMHALGPRGGALADTLKIQFMTIQWTAGRGKTTSKRMYKGKADHIPFGMALSPLSVHEDPYRRVPW